MLPLRSARPLRLVAAGGGLLGVVLLAGCSAASATASGTSSSGSSSGGSGSSTHLKDGSYQATGHYTAPNGASEIGVALTLKGGTITAVTVTPETPNPTARQYESQFAAGIGGVAVGKPIAGLQVGAVSGSSLTGRGFEDALAAIRGEAAA